MQSTILHLHPNFTVGEVDPRIFGGFLEHMGRAVYEGVYQPGSVRADADGFRTDVLDALARLKMTAMRYPGGNFASGYHWTDGIGPVDERPTMRELAWQSIETNRFGTDEFIALCRRMNWTPMLTVNLGTGTPEEARNWVEYCNCVPGTRYADLRPREAKPYDVTLWCLGNEMDGPWQLGHVPAEQYAIRAQQAAKMMKDVDPSIELVACGSCGTGLATYMAWDRTVLEHLGNTVDYVSLHRYVGNRDGDTPDYLAVGASIDKQIEEMDAACRYVQAKARSDKRAFLCFDEWNVWYKDHTTDGRGRHAPHLIEEVYNLEDALVVAGFLMSFIRHADVVKIANLAQIVNVIAPVLTRDDDLLVQSIFYPFEMISARRSGVALHCALDGPTYDSANYGTVHAVDAASIVDDDRLHVFLVNRGVEEPAEVRIDWCGGAVESVETAEIVAAAGAQSANRWDDKEAVVSKPFDGVQVASGTARAELPPLSFAAMTLRLA